MGMIPFKYPRTFHLFGSRIASGDKMLSEAKSREVLSWPCYTYVWESKLDGSNLGLFFDNGNLIIQNRGHILGTGEHPQYKLMDHPPIYGEDRPEGLYLKVEKDGVVVGRYKLVHDEFIQSIIDSDKHWKYDVMVRNSLADGVDILRPVI